MGFVGLGAGQVSLQPGVLGGPSSENSKPGKAPVPQPYTEEQKVHFIALSLPLLCCVTRWAGLIKKPPARPRRLSLWLWELTGTSSRISPIGPNVRRVPIKKPKLRSGGRAGEGKRRKGRAESTSATAACPEGWTRRCSALPESGSKLGKAWGAQGVRDLMWGERSWSWQQEGC